LEGACYDVVVLGSGVAGLTCAVVAHDAGLSVVVLEKAPKVGGVTAYSGGGLWVPNNHLMKEAGLSDSLEEAMAYARFLSPVPPDEELLVSWLKGAPEAVRYLEERAGIKWQIVRGYPDYYYPRAGKPEGRYLEAPPIAIDKLGEYSDKLVVSPHVPVGITHGEMLSMGGQVGFRNWDFTLLGDRLKNGIMTFGPGLVCNLLRALLERKVPIHLSTPARRLISRAGRVVGVVAEKDGETITFESRRGVLIATGGYDWDRDLFMRFEGLPEWGSTAPPFVEGDNLKLACELGAAVTGVPPYALPTLLSVRVPGEEHFGRPLYRLLLEAGAPGYIIVNKSGRRFVNESFYYNVVSKVRAFDSATSSWPNWPCYLVFDHRTRERYTLATLAPGMPLPEGMGVTCDTLAELADRLGIDREELARTVSRFNTFAEKGVDEDFHRGEIVKGGDPSNKPNPNLAPIRDPPFYGVKLEIGSVGVNAIGLKIDGRARVLDVHGNPIPGLYAAGNSAATVDTSGGYNSGLGNSRGMTLGYIAARDMSGL